MRRIERGEYSATEFIDELKVQIDRIVRDVMSDNSQRHIETGTAPATPAASPADGAEGTAAASAANATPAKPKAPRKPAVRKLEQIICPLCGKGHLLKGRTAYGCSEFRAGCALRLPFEQYPADLTPGKLNALLKKNPPTS